MQTAWTSGGTKRHTPIAIASSRWRECILIESKLLEAADLILNGEARTGTELLVKKERGREMEGMRTVEGTLPWLRLSPGTCQRPCPFSHPGSAFIPVAPGFSALAMIASALDCFTMGSCNKETVTH